MIEVPRYRAIVDKAKAAEARAKLEELNIPEENAEVIEDRVVVIGYRDQYDDFLVIHSDGSSSFVGRARVTFATSVGAIWFSLVP